MSVKKTIIFLLVTLSLFIAAYFTFQYFTKSASHGDSSTSSKELDRYFTVKRSDLILGVTLTGTVNAKKKHKLSCEAAFRTKLVSIVDESAKVKKGDVLAEFETEELLQKIDDLKVELENKRKSLDITKEEREILVSSNAADIEAAKNRVVEAEQSFHKYWKLEGPKEKNLQQLTVDSAEQKLKEAEAEYLTFRDKHAQTVYSDGAAKVEADNKLRALSKKVAAAQTTLNTAMLDQKIFKRYTYPDKIASLKHSWEEMKLNLKKTTIRTASLLVQKDNQLFNAKIRIQKNERDLKKFEGFLPQMKLVSPVDGVVIYGDPDKRWRKIDIKIGMDIRRRQVLLTIPDMSRLVVDFDIPEQYRSKVKLKDKVLITPESISTLTIDGIVSEIASIPKNQIRWDPYSPKIYKSVISVVRKEPRIVSGMNVRLAIINRILKNRLIVPVEAVFDKSGKYFVFLKKNGSFKQVDVEIGEANDSSVEIKSGLSENDVVCLFRPFQGEKKK